MRLGGIASLVLLSGLVLLHAQEEIIRKNKKVEIEFTEVRGAQAYEIEWLKGEKFDSDSDKCFENETLTNSPFIGIIPIECGYFRMRSIAEKPSRWTDVYQIPGLEPDGEEGPFRTVKDADGNEVLFLIAKDLDLSRFSDKKPLFYKLNHDPIKPYQQPLQFKENGRYHLRIYSKKEDGNYKLERELIFFVDTTRPTSSLELLHPFYFGKRRLVFSANSVVRIDAKDTDGAGIAGVYVRMRPESTRESVRIIPPYLKYTPETTLGDLMKMAFVAPSEGRIVLQWFAEDRMGNREKPRRASFHLDIRGPQIKKLTSLSKVAFEVKDESLPVKVSIHMGSEQVYSGEVRDVLVVPEEVVKRWSGSRVTIRAIDYLDNKAEIESDL